MPKRVPCHLEMWQTGSMARQAMAIVANSQPIALPPLLVEIQMVNSTAMQANLLVSCHLVASTSPISLFHRHYLSTNCYRSLLLLMMCRPFPSSQIFSESHLRPIFDRRPFLCCPNFSVHALAKCANPIGFLCPISNRIGHSSNCL